MRDKQLLEILATNIRHIRNDMEYSQSELAERAGISNGYMCDIENAKKWPAAEKLTALARVLNVQPYQLILPSVDSPHFDRHHTLSSFTRNVKMAMANTVDEVFENMMETYSPSKSKKENS